MKLPSAEIRYPSAVYLGTVLACLLTLIGCGLTPIPPIPTVNLTSVDFSPDDGTYNVNWPGPPRRPWTNADREFYQVTATLSARPPGFVGLHFWVKEDRSLASDPILGDLLLLFDENHTTAESGFWLVCTQLGRLRGNIAREDDGHAWIYLELEGPSVQDFGTWILRYTAVRKKHLVVCSDAGTAPPGVHCPAGSRRCGNLCVPADRPCPCPPGSGTTRKCGDDDKCYSPDQSCE